MNHLTVTSRRKCVHTQLVIGVYICTPVCSLLDEALHPYVADFGFLIVVPIEHGSRCLITGPLR